MELAEVVLSPTIPPRTSHPFLDPDRAERHTHPALLTLERPLSSLLSPTLTDPLNHTSSSLQLAECCLMLHVILCDDDGDDVDRKK